jgi:prepilin-type N-terminal cleavage/methylation domain-containing protein
MTARNTPEFSRTGFTLTEMLIAVAILSVVILATSTIFGTAQRVASVAEANSDLVQQAASIERRIRRDIQRMSTDGFLAVQCVSVENGVNVSDGGPLLDPSRPEFFPGTSVPVTLRCDQLVFFTDGRESTTRFQESFEASGTEPGRYAPAEGSVAMIYLGHGVQMPYQPPRASTSGATLYDFARDADQVNDNGGLEVYPWSFLTGNDAPDVENVSGSEPVSGGTVPLINPSAPDWLIKRQAVLLADDDLGSVDVQGSDYPSAYDPSEFFGTGFSNSVPNLFVSVDPLIFDRGFVSGRVDIAASELDDIRRDACIPWSDLGMPIIAAEQMSPLIKRDQLLDAIFLAYPRGERTAPSMLNLDQMLSNNVLAGHVSDFVVEWTWEDGVGRDLTVSDIDFPGGLPGVVASGNNQVWFGLGQVAEGRSDAELFIGEPVFSAVNPSNNNIESFNLDEPDGVSRYGAVFGLNRDRGFLRGSDNRPIGYSPNPSPEDPPSLWFFDTIGAVSNGSTVFANTYTPWPTALRITMRLHDPGDVIEGGRVFQFVVPLPQQD